MSQDDDCENGEVKSSGNFFDLEKEMRAALASGNFWRVCVFAAQGRGEFAPIEEAATHAGLSDAFARDKRLATYAVKFEDDVAVAIANIGKPLRYDAFKPELMTFHIPKGSKIGIHTRVCSDIIIAGEGLNHASERPHLHVFVKSPDGIWNETDLLRSEVAGGQWQRHLIDKGLKIGKEDVLKAFLLGVEPSHKFDIVEHAGWNGPLFVLPSGEVSGADAADVRSVFQTTKGWQTGGTMEGANEMLRLLDNNELFVLGVCAALTAPVLEGLNAEPGGFNIYGESTQGKTTWLCACASPWGKGAEERFGGIVGTWNSTAFAAQELAAMTSDCPLFRDEVRLMPPKVFQEITYALCQGVAKKAGAKTGGLKDEKRFRPIIMSAGEMSSKAHVESEHGLQYHAGMTVRLIDMPVTRGKGIFSEVPGRFKSAADFAKYILKQSSTHHGHHARAFLQLLADDKAGVLAHIRRNVALVREYLDERGAGDEAQNGRVADRFALVFAVGATCVHYGILPWTIDNIIDAARKTFAGWMAERGGKGSQDAIAGHTAFCNNWLKHRARFKHGTEHPQNAIGYFRHVPLNDVHQRR